MQYNFSIDKDDLNNIKYYNLNYLDNSEIGNICKDLFKEWIGKYKLPLSITLLNHFLEQPEDFISILDNLNKQIGIENIKRVFDELKKEQSSNEIQLNKKIESLMFEIKLLQMINFSRIIKINNKGDWEIDGKIISVKSKLPIDWNYSAIGTIIKAIVMTNNMGISNFNEIIISSDKGIKDSEMNNIYSQIIGIFLEKKYENENKKIKVEEWTPKSIIITLNIDSNPLELKMKKSEQEGQKGIISFSSKDGAFRNTEKMNPEVIKSAIDRLNKNYNSCSMNERNGFIGIILVDTHNMHFKNVDNYDMKYNYIDVQYPLYTIFKKKWIFSNNKPSQAYINRNKLNAPLKINEKIVGVHYMGVDGR